MNEEQIIHEVRMELEREIQSKKSLYILDEIDGETKCRLEHTFDVVDIKLTHELPDYVLIPIKGPHSACGSTAQDGRSIESVAQMEFYSQRKKASPKRKRTLLTANDLEVMEPESGGTVVISADCMITPLARDYIAEHQITLKRSREV